MKVDIQIPEKIGLQLQRECHDVPRRVLEAVAIEAYRSDALSHEQAGDLLGLSFWETEAFLKERLGCNPEEIACSGQPRRNGRSIPSMSETTAARMGNLSPKAIPCRDYSAKQQHYSVGEQMRRLLKLIATKPAEEMTNKIEFLSDWE